MKNLPITNDTIVALSTPQGVGAIGVIRLSGANAIIICEKVFANLHLKPKTLQDKASHTIHFGVLHDEQTIVDEVLVSLFKGPNSYTSENTIEVSCHGSPYIQQQIIQLFIKHGARMATEGEFTLRAFLNGKLDLSQAEAVADLIASNSDASHQLAMQQMRGGFSDKIKELRQKLIDFASLIELELDFSEEDVEFADRTDLKILVNKIQGVVQRLISSFDLGNVIKNGIPVAIVGKPNVGKSTLLNALLNEDKAIVSEIAGTTRDAIEDELTINGVVFRFIDTAGIRVTDDVIEGIGVKKTFEKIKQASITIYMFDIQTTSPDELKLIVEELTPQLNNSKLVLVGNKLDDSTESSVRENFSNFDDLILISAKAQQNLENLKERLTYLFNQKMVSVTDTVVTNARHFEALGETDNSLQKVLEGLDDNISGDFLAMDIRNALHYLGTITGDISTDDLLANIFSRFCIGK